MVDFDPLFRVTEAVDLFPILGIFPHDKLYKIKLISSNSKCNYITSQVAWDCRMLAFTHVSKSRRLLSVNLLEERGDVFHKKRSLLSYHRMKLKGLQCLVTYYLASLVCQT